MSRSKKKKNQIRKPGNHHGAKEITITDPEEKAEIDAMIDDYLKQHKAEYLDWYDETEEWNNMTTSTNKTSVAIDPKTGKPTVSATNWKGNWQKFCEHKPTLLIEGDDIKIYAGKRCDVIDELNDFNLAVNLTGDSVKMNHKFGEFTQLEKYSSQYRFKEIVLDWPDYGVIYFPLDFWLELAQVIKKVGGKVVFFCIGGHGRTGTAIAAMMITYLEWDAWAAIDWIRKNYCSEAVESKEQENYLVRLCQAYRTRFPKDEYPGPVVETKIQQPELPLTERMTEDEAHAKAGKMWENGFAYVDASCKFCVIDNGEESFTGNTFEICFQRAAEKEEEKKSTELLDKALHKLPKMTKEQASIEASVRWPSKGGFAYYSTTKPDGTPAEKPCVIFQFESRLEGRGMTFEEAFEDVENKIRDNVSSTRQEEVKASAAWATD